MQVSGAADFVLQTKCKCSKSGAVCGDELEVKDFVHRVFELLAGSPVDTDQHACKSAVSPQLRIKLYDLCCKSVVACKLVPRTLEVRCSCCLLIAYLSSTLSKCTLNEDFGAFLNVATCLIVLLCFLLCYQRVVLVHNCVPTLPCIVYAT